MSPESLEWLGGALVAFAVFYGLYKFGKARSNIGKIEADSDRLVDRPRDGGSDSQK